MKHLLNIMRQQAELVAGSIASARCGVVSSYDPNNYCAKVLIQPENIESGWLPVLSQWVGNGWGLFSPVSIGDNVEGQFQEGSFEHGFVCNRFFNDNVRPLNVPCGEFWLVHGSGQFIKLCNDGTITSNGIWNHTGGFNVTGTITATVDVLANGKSGHNHTHNDPQGGSVSAPV